MTHASLKYAQLLTEGEIFQGDLFMPTKYQRDGPKNDQDCVQHSGPKCVGFVDENQPPTRQVDFGEAQAIDAAIARRHVHAWDSRLQACTPRRYFQHVRDDVLEGRVMWHRPSFVVAMAGVNADVFDRTGKENRFTFL